MIATAGLRTAALALILGAATNASFAPIGWWWLGPVTLAGLIWLWRGAPPRTCALAGFAFGLGLYGTGISWVYVSMHEYGAMPAPLAALATLLFAAYLALWPALAGVVQARFAGGAPACLIVPSAWCLTEWLRGWIFTGFPWLGVGYAHTDGPLAGFAPVIGVHGINFVVALVASLAVALAAGLARRPPSGPPSRWWPPGGPPSRWWHTALLIMGVLGAGAALRSVQWAQPHGSPLRIALLQGNIPQDLKFDEGRFDATLALYRRLVEAHPATLVVLPETALPRMQHAIPPQFLADLAALSRARGADIIYGVPLAESRDRYFNSALSLGASMPQRYDKAHLVPFGEFVPWGFRWFVDAMRIPLGDFTSGSRQPAPMQLGGQRVAVNICYEDLFGEEIIRQLPAATLLVNISNIAWFGDSLAPRQHLQISRMRAIESARPMLRATNTGMTAIIDHRGRVPGQLAPFTEGALVGTVQAMQGATPYARTGNWPAIGFSALALLWAAARARAARARRPS